MAEIKVPIKVDGFKCVEDMAQAVLNYTYKGKTLKEWVDSISEPQTNADRLRAMTDEELANQLAAEQYVGIRTFLLGFDKELLEDLDEEIKMAWPEAVKEKLNWLKQETEA